MKFFGGLVLLVFVCCANGQQFKCPPKDGQYEDPVQCDKFYVCEEGIATPKLCPDGLVYDPLIRKINKCDQPFNVDCGDRIELQPPQPSPPYCPRRNGFFAHPDPKVCNVFFNCIEGEPTESKCTAGLLFDELTGTCVWPDSTQRQGCEDTSTRKLKDGFECPKEHQTDANGNVVVHPKYAHPTDCQRFYVCLNGQEPRDLGCQVGEVYNEDSQRCDAPENVPGCEDWYKDEPSAGKPVKKSRK
ncbi:protein obstructor-E [Agrilus planipennis]|uniref:Protein obstructor-E n=1 Tax=Agrilus planipennis TaxID=224129 RepID=A0A7F5R6B3_AGRPL|nr:protein obstructor-E [Agrilus planipennis]